MTRSRYIRELSEGNADIVFLKELSLLTLQELEKKLQNFSHKSCPRWKQVAIRRAIRKISPEDHPVSWVLALDEFPIQHMREPDRTNLRQTKERIKREEGG